MVEAWRKTIGIKVNVKACEKIMGTKMNTEETTEETFGVGVNIV